MSFRIVFKKRNVSLNIRNTVTDDILGNFTCKIASGEWDDFISLGLIDKPDERLLELANTFLNHYFKTREQEMKLSAYAELAEKYGAGSSSYNVKRAVIRPMITEEKPIIADAYTVESLKDVLFLEMLYAVEQNMHIVRCKNCLKYFSTAYAGADYCDRIYKDDKSCKWIGSKKTYFSNIKADDNLVLYEKIYQSLQYKKRRATESEIINLIEHRISCLRLYRLRYKNEEISAEEFIEKINDIKSEFE